MSPQANARPATELWNADLAPTDAAHRTWTTWHYVSLWIGMVVCIPGYMLAAGLLRDQPGAGGCEVV